MLDGDVIAAVKAHPYVMARDVEYQRPINLTILLLVSSHLDVLYPPCEAHILLVSGRTMLFSTETSYNALIGKVP